MTRKFKMGPEMIFYKKLGYLHELWRNFKNGCKGVVMSDIAARKSIEKGINVQIRGIVRL